MTLKRLDDLLSLIQVLRKAGKGNRDICDITADSREVKEGSLFVCLVGEHADGHDFVKEAAENGAAAILAEKEVTVSAPTTVIYVENTRKAMERIVPAFFDYPSRKMRIIGVTGTNGKTTVTHIISHILRHAGYKTGLIGTVHALVGDEELPMHNTTPDIIDLQRLLARMVTSEVSHVCMEVSSHALVMGRVEGCEFDTAVFTNLTEDHLDYHKTMEAYAKAKSLLFEKVSEEGQSKIGKSAWINADDEYANVMGQAVLHRDVCALHTYGMKGNVDLLGKEGRFADSASCFEICRNGESCVVNTRLVGRFNMYNTMAAIGATLSEGVDMTTIMEALADFRAVPGRFELIDEGQPFSVIVDYAHTPDGLEKILATAKDITEGRMITVFGCGGDRDRMKRPVMGRIAAEYSNAVIVTSDNPRTEDPMGIIAEVETGVRQIGEKKENFRYEVVPDRREAIRKAIVMAREKDMVIIAGKGHENYQILKNRTIHFDDREEARHALRESTW